MSIKTYTLKALASAEAYADAINHLRAECAKLDYDAARAQILPVVAGKFKVALVDGKGKSKGTLVLNRKAVKYEAARKAIQRLMADLYETVKDEAQTRQRISAEVRTAAQAYLAHFESVADAIKALRAVAK